MKCYFCPNTIDELQEFPPHHGPEQVAHSAELSKWQQVTVTVQRNGGSEHLLSVHTCPSENLQPGQLELTKKVAS